jgi:cation-transporting ATPase F
MTMPQWQCIDGHEALAAAGTSVEQGLSGAEVERRREQFGPNALTRKKGTSPVLLFILQFNQPLIYILLAAGAVTAFLGEWVDSSVIFGVVLVNAVIGFIQEAKAVKAIESLARSMISEATVVRDGRKQRIRSEDLTFGDIVMLQSGDKVPADLRIIRVRELHIDESVLTGESVPVVKQTGTLAQHTVLADRLNMA